MMNSLDSWARDAAQNPYLILFGLLLAVLSAWQPVAKIVSAARAFLKDVIAHGIKNATERVFKAADVKAVLIAYDEAKSTKILIIDLGWSLRMGLITVFVLLMSAILHINSVADPSNTIVRFVAAIYGIVGGVSALVWLIDTVFQSMVHTRVRQLIRKKDPLE